MSDDAKIFWILVGSILTLTMGALVATGRWRTPVLKVYPGVGVGLIFMSLGFILAMTLVLLLKIWPSTWVPSPAAISYLLVPMSLLSMLYGFFVGAVGPKRLLPRWQREELEREKNAER